MADLSHLKRVLVAEDEALILLDVAQSLEDFGVAEVITVTTVEEALLAGPQPGDEAAVGGRLTGRGRIAPCQASELVPRWRSSSTN